MGFLGLSIEKKEKQKEEVDYSKVYNEISKDSFIKGDLFSDSNVRYRGKIKGNIHTKNGVHVEKGGEVEGDIDAFFVNVSGKISGNIKNKKCVINIEQGSYYKGNISADTVNVRGNFEGIIVARKVVIHKSAKMRGKISTIEISVEDNKNLELEFKILKERSEEKKDE